LLEKIQHNLFETALARQKQNTVLVDSWDSFVESLEKGGYVSAFWCERTECELEIKEKTKATTRCLPFDATEELGAHICVHCGKTCATGKAMVFCQIVLVCKKQKTALIESCFLFLSRPSFAAMVGRVGRLFARTEFASGAGSLADLAVGAQVEPQAL
jgi:hypothetical protein